MSFPQQVPQFIGGEWQQSQTQQWIPVTNPANQEVLTQVPCATTDEMEQAIASAAATFESWKETPVPTRARIMLQ